MMVNLQFRDHLIENCRKITIHVPSHMIAIAICELPGFPCSHMTNANETAKLVSYWGSIFG